MRLIILATALVALAPSVTFAQSYPPGNAVGPGLTGGNSYYPSGPATPLSNRDEQPGKLWNSRRTQSLPTDAAAHKLFQKTRQ
jgi:hypothetical protein